MSENETGENVVEEEVNATSTETAEDVSDNGANTETNTEDTTAQQGAEESSSTPTMDINAVTLPEGMSASDEDKKSVLATAERFGINTQEGLQGFVDWIVESAEKNKAETEASRAKSKQEWEEIKSSWKTSLQSDADFGKDYDGNIERANKALQQFGGSELTSWLKDADLIEHPAILKTFARIGKEIEDAKILTGTRSVASSGVQRDRYNQPMIKYKD